MRRLHDYTDTEDVIETADRLQADWAVIYHDPTDASVRTDYSVHRYAELARNAAAEEDVPTSIYSVADGKLHGVGLKTGEYRSRWAPSVPGEVPR